MNPATGRRHLGMALVLAVVVVAVALPSGGGQRLAGTPTPAALAQPPQVGQCLLMPRQERSKQGETPLTAATFGSCLGPTLGEVVAVHHRAGDSSAPPTDESCRASTVHYAGLRDSAAGYVPAFGDFPPTSVGEPAAGDGRTGWTYPFRADTRWVAQAPGLPARTNDWYACVSSPPTTWQQGSLSGAFVGGRLPGGYGRCWVASNPEPGDAMVACLWPHTSELIGIADANGDSNESAVQPSCQDLAGGILDRADPTVDGALSAGVGRGNPVDPTVSDALFCYLRTSDGRLINGSLVGMKSASLDYQL